MPQPDQARSSRTYENALLAKIVRNSNLTSNRILQRERRNRIFNRRLDPVLWIGSAPILEQQRL
jgi:hypothetical protein